MKDRHDSSNYIYCAIIVTPRRTSTCLPPSKTTLLNEIFAVKFVAVNGCVLVMTKLKLLVAPGSSPFLFWPITHFVECPTILPWASWRKQTARADCTVRPKLFFIVNCTTAIWLVTFGDMTVTASCAVAISGQSSKAAKRKIWWWNFMA